MDEINTSDQIGEDIMPELILSNGPSDNALNLDNGTGGGRMEINSNKGPGKFFFQYFETGLGRLAQG